MTRPGEEGGGRDPAKRGKLDAPLVLYRCRTPTNVLCPCGAVARRMASVSPASAASAVSMQPPSEIAAKVVEARLR